MLENLTDELKSKILLEITKNLIINSRAGSLFKLNEIILEEQGKATPLVISKENIQEEVKEKLSERKKSVNLFEDKKFNFPKTELNKKIGDSFSKNKKSVFQKRILKIPEEKLPKNLIYLKPTITGQKIDLGKLNVFVNDSKVRVIEISGENEKIIVEGLMGRKSTGISLSKGEINEVIKRFSFASKIPVPESGAYKVAVGKILLIAMISESVSSNFIIKKI